MSDLQTTLDEFIRRLGLDDDRLDQLERRTTALDQGIRNLWTDGLGGSNACLTTLNGTITGGLAPTGSVYVPMPNTSLRVVGHTSGIDYGTYSVSTGTYSLSLILDPSDTSLDLYPFGPVSPRFNSASPLVYTQPITQCGTNAMAAVIPPAAPGYGYLIHSFSGTFACQYPVGVLDWTDSRIGSGTTTLVNFGPAGISALGSWLSACLTSNTFAAAPCVARATVPMMFSMLVDGRALVNYMAASIGGCPVAGTCPGVGIGNGSFTYAPVLITSKTCPSFDLSTKFDCTWFTNDQLLHNSASHTIRFYEP